MGLGPTTANSAVPEKFGTFCDERIAFSAKAPVVALRVDHWNRTAIARRAASAVTTLPFNAINPITLGAAANSVPLSVATLASVRRDRAGISRHHHPRPTALALVAGMLPRLIALSPDELLNKHLKGWQPLTFGEKYRYGRKPVVNLWWQSLRLITYRRRPSCPPGGLAVSRWVAFGENDAESS
jgi:hypothetical protein